MERNNRKEEKTESLVDLNDLIGQFGPYQFNVMLFNFVREGTVAIDSVALSLALHPDIDYQCIPPTNNKELDIGCEYLDKNGSVAPCLNWEYPNTSLEGTLTVEYDLICDRKMLGSLLMTSYFFGTLFGKFLWGYLSDKLGRWTSHTIAHCMAFLFSVAGLFAPSIYLLMFTRFAIAFGSTGFSILCTVQVEMIGARHRAFATTANHLGWGFGIISLAFIGIETNSWRYIAGISPVLMLIGLPWLLILPESIRWLKVHGKYEAARKEIKRAAAYNSVKIRRDADFDSKIDQYLTTDIDNNKIAQDEPKKKKASVFDLFKHSLFCLNIVTLWLALLFNNYIYYTRTIHFSKDHRSIFANFIISGVSELVCLVISLSFMLVFKRKTCMALFICVTGLTCFAETIISITSDLLVRSFALVAILDIIAKISAINGVIILFLVAYEVFPTELRERGSSIIMTSTAFGGILAPFSPRILQLVGGQLNYSIIIAVISLVLSFSLGWLVTETKDVDVTDTIKESTDQQANRKKDRKLQK